MFQLPHAVAWSSRASAWISYDASYPLSCCRLISICLVLYSSYCSVGFFFNYYFFTIFFIFHVFLIFFVICSSFCILCLFILWVAIFRLLGILIFQWRLLSPNLCWFLSFIQSLIKVDYYNAPSDSTSFPRLDLFPNKDSYLFALMCAIFALMFALSNPLRRPGHLFDQFLIFCNYCCIGFVCFGFVIGSPPNFWF